MLNLFNKLRSKEFEQMFMEALEKEMAKPKSKNERYNAIADNYFMLFTLLNINSFHSFHFPDYEDCRVVVVDEKEYDFDNEFCHNDLEATEALCAIDCLIADLEATSMETILKEVEKRVNYQNTNAEE
ncbi:MAG: hypothetical protein IKJ16_00540 [Agathobacter sp.]|nr:hypothetical protein [Agathobacter sp.]